MNIEAFHSNGKLLISGEYLVLDGALAMAVPTKFGQRLDVSLHDSFSGIRWEAHVLNKGWLHVSFGSRLFNIIHTNDQKLALHLKKILKKAFELGNITVDNQKGILIRTNLDFDKNWGLGSSSTLLSNIGYWLDVDPYSLSKETSNGSGFDVAAARSNSPFFYQLIDGKPEISSIDFQPQFKDQLYFVHLNSKKNSEESVKSYKTKVKANQQDVGEVSSLSRIIAGAMDLVDFDKALLEHENILSKVLGIDRIKKQFFSDFPGEIKSLGAWGGDFVMATYSGAESNLREYFKSKGKNTVLRFDDMVL